MGAHGFVVLFIEVGCFSRCSDAESLPALEVVLLLIVFSDKWIWCL